MSRQEIGLGLQSNKSPEEYAHLAVLAESHDFDVISVFSDLLFQPPIFPLLEMARVTRRVRLGAACWNPYTQHPYELAGQLAALDRASGGRAYLGLARGAWLGDIGLRQPRPLTHLREAARLIYRLLARDETGFEGQAFSLAPGTALKYEPLRADPPLLIGAWGAQAAALAGEIADEIKIGGTANPEMVEVMRRRLQPGIERAGRAATDIGIVVGAVTVVDRDSAAARLRARREVALYLPVVAELDPTVEVPTDLIETLNQLVAEGRDEEAGALIPDHLLDLFCISGDPDEVAAQAQALLDSGVSRLEFGTPHGLSDESGVDLLGSAVIPLLRRRDIGRSADTHAFEPTPAG